MSTATQPTHKYHPIQDSLGKIEDLGARLYNRFTPAVVDGVIKESRLVAKTTQSAVAIKQVFDPMINAVDSYASVLLEWGVDKYKTLFLNNLHKLTSTLKDFYSSENNDYARVCLRFLTLAIPNPNYLDVTTLEKFIESFRFDPQFHNDKFQKILTSFYRHASKHWLIGRASKPLEIVQNALYVVAGTMEETLIPPAKKVPNFAQKMADYFITSSPSRTLFSRKHFRHFYKQLLQLHQLDEEDTRIADQFLQISSVLFDLTSMSNKDLVDWTVHSFKFVKSSINNVVNNCTSGCSAVVSAVAKAVPTEPIKGLYTSAAATAKTVFEIGKDGVVTIFHKVIDFSPMQVSLDMAYQVDRVLRNKGKGLIRIFKKNRVAFADFVKVNREDILEFIRDKKSCLEDKTVETKEAVVDFLSHRVEDMKTAVELGKDVADVGKDISDLAIEVVADYGLAAKERVGHFVVKHYESIKSETRHLTSLVFRVLRVDEIGAFTMKTLKGVEEYLCIKESLSKLDLLTNKSVAEVEKRHILDQPAELDVTVEQAKEEEPSTQH